jgi:hypothetical protein
MGEYAEYFARTGRAEMAVAIHHRLYVAVRATSLPTKATSDVSYDLACALARNGRADEAMTYLPDGLPRPTTSKRCRSLKNWAQQDPDLASLREREDFRRLVTVVNEVWTGSLRPVAHRSVLPASAKPRSRGPRPDPS